MKTSETVKVVDVELIPGVVFTANWTLEEAGKAAREFFASHPTLYRLQGFPLFTERYLSRTEYRTTVKMYGGLNMCKFFDEAMSALAFGATVLRSQSNKREDL